MASSSDYPHRIFLWLVSLVFPYRCLGCREFLEHGYICQPCLQSVPVRYRLECIGCRQTSPGGLTCDDCKKENPLNRVFIVADYRDPVVARAIRAMKYKFLQELAEPLAQLASTYIQNQVGTHKISFPGENFVVIPIPMHQRRQNWRGFNQAVLMADLVAARYRLERSDTLVRVSHRATQAGISDRSTRMQNIKHAYTCPLPDSVQGRNVLLIDDVCTTGATLNECARVLKSVGARTVSALVIARG